MSNINADQLEAGFAELVERKIVPIFIMFLDSVSQLIKMNPQNFEFNSKFLAHLAVESLNGRHFEFV